MEYKKTEYSRNKIKKAGKCLAKGTDDIFELRDSTDVLDNWRAAHAYPLQVVASNLRRRTKGKDIIVVQRLKRRDSIIAKLARKPNISLYDMQDLAGCRVIVHSVADVYNVSNDYSSKVKHAEHKTDDYIKNPKKTGYRSLHIIYRFYSDSEISANFNGMFVEVQFRTQLQHLWSTAVETMGIYTGTNLKAGEGPPEILRFFALVSSLFANEENQPSVPNTPTTKEDIAIEIKTVLVQHPDILKALRAIRVATHEIARRGNNAEYYILVLNFSTNTLSIKEYSTDEVEKATKDYNAIEHQGAENKLNAVLVSASSIDELRRAYPNYFSDIGDFVKRIDDIIA